MHVVGMLDRIFRGWVGLTLLLLFAAAASSAVAQPAILAPPQGPHVLILHSYHHGYAWADDTVRGIVDALPANAQVSIEYMDAKRYSAEAYLDMLRAQYQWKYRGQQFDVIVVCDDTAFRFIRRHGTELFGSVPVVFCGVTDIDEQAMEADPFYTGISEHVHLGDTLRLAARLHPDAKAIYVVHDRTPTSLAFRARLEAVAAGGELAIPLVFMNDDGRLSLTELEKRLAELPADSIVFYSDLFIDGDGGYVDYRTFLPRLSAACSAPIYSHADMYLGLGIVGGRLKSAYYLGESAGRMATQILSGTPVADLPIDQDGATRWMFDHTQLQRWDIALQQLPADRILIHEPDSFYTRNRVAIILGLVITVVQTGIIAGLIWNIAVRRRAERARRASEQRFRELADRLDQVFWVSTPDDHTLYVSPAIEPMFELTADQVTASPRAWMRRVHPADVDRLTAALDELRDGKPLDVQFRIVRSDGTVRWVEDRGFPIVENGRVVRQVGLVSDITERKCSEQEIRDLARFPEENPSPVLRVTGEGLVLYANQPAGTLLAALCPGCGDTVPLDWHGAIRQALREKTTQQFDVSSDGRTYSLTVTPIVDGGHVNIYGSDITDRREAEHRQRLAMRELDHRVKNNLAAVQSLAEQSLMRVDSLSQFRDSFLGRISAMARTHEALAQARWSSINLRDAATLVLGPYLHDGRFALCGDEVRLPSRAALPIGLALHELATNAMKYGALSTPAGRVELVWREAADRSIDITWTETGGPAIAEPQSQGTGTTLIRGLISYELQGTVELLYPPPGAVCKMHIPAERSSRGASVADKSISPESS